MEKKKLHEKNIPNVFGLYDLPSEERKNIRRVGILAIHHFFVVETLRLGLTVNKSLQGCQISAPRSVFGG